MEINQTTQNVQELTAEELAAQKKRQRLSLQNKAASKTKEIQEYTSQIRMLNQEMKNPCLLVGAILIVLLPIIGHFGYLYYAYNHVANHIAYLVGTEILDFGTFRAALPVALSLSPELAAQFNNQMNLFTYGPAIMMSFVLIFGVIRFFALSSKRAELKSLTEKITAAETEKKTLNEQLRRLQ